MATRRTLVVEGDEDSRLFRALARNWKLPHIDMVCTPSGKGNAIRTFGSTVSMQTRASDSRIGVVVDADYLPSGLGFVGTRDAIDRQLMVAGAAALVSRTAGGFESTYPGARHVRIGAWIMPDNRSDGYVEHAVVAAISANEQARFDYTKLQCATALNPAMSGLSFPVKSIHVTKAEAGAWLALQDPPRMSLGNAVSSGLLDLTRPSLSNLGHWLNWLFI